MMKMGSGGGRHGRPRFPAVGHKADAGKAMDQHRPGRRLRNGIDLYRHVAQLPFVRAEELEIEGVDAREVGIEIQGASQKSESQVFAVLIQRPTERRIIPYRLWIERQCPAGAGNRQQRVGACQRTGIDRELEIPQRVARFGANRSERFSLGSALFRAIARSQTYQMAVCGLSQKISMCPRSSR